MIDAVLVSTMLSMARCHASCIFCRYLTRLIASDADCSQHEDKASCNEDLASNCVWSNDISVCHADLEASDCQANSTDTRCKLAKLLLASVPCDYEDGYECTTKSHCTYDDDAGCLVNFMEHDSRVKAATITAQYLGSAWAAAAVTVDAACSEQVSPTKCWEVAAPTGVCQYTYKAGGPSCLPTLDTGLGSIPAVDDLDRCGS